MTEGAEDAGLGAETVEDESETRSSSLGLWFAVALLVAAAFVAGMLMGIVIDGNAEVMRDFRDRNPSPPPSTRIVSAPDPAPESAPASPSAPAVTERRANNEVDWAITIAPGTGVGVVDATSADLDHDSKIEFGMVLGTHVSPVATLWVRSASSARIVLPQGRYSIRTTRVAQESGGPPSDPVVLPGTLAVVRDTADRDPPKLIGGASGAWRVVDGGSPSKPVRRTRRRAVRGSEFEYDGLGESSRDGGAATYGG